MTLTPTAPTELVDLSSIKTVKQVPYTEYFVSGHRTCQGCESALVMRYIAKAAGPRTVVLGSTGCMYVANTSYYTTPWVVPWMHTQLGAAGSAAPGAAGALVAGHPDAAYIATACASYGVDFMNKVRKGLAAGGPAFIHVLDPCPKGWHYDPQLSHELGKLAIETGIWSLWEMEDHTVKLNGTTRAIATGRAKRKPVREYLSQQGRFAHFTE